MLKAGYAAILKLKERRKEHYHYATHNGRRIIRVDKKRRRSHSKDATFQNYSCIRWEIWGGAAVIER